jgi:UDP-4-amino-4,6-dideoxy-L-N-acetyl-beta-L-altrosamine transaminase
VIPYSKQSISDEDIQAAAAAMRSTHLTQGKYVKAFEDDLRSYIGCEYVSVLNSATSALFSVYKTLGLNQGDEVITTPLSFVATANMLVECGVTPVFVDIKYDGNIDESKIEAKITEKTKAIVSVDYAGNAVRYEAIQALCKKHGLKFISDASHALGSSVGGVKVGNFADATVFSFHAIKPITTFEGGAVATNDKSLYDAIELFKSHGIVKKSLWNSDMVSMGYNFRLSDVACAVGQSQLKRLDDFIQKREKIALTYDKAFENNPYFSTIQLSCRSSRHLYPVLLHRSLHCAKEDIFQELIEKGIGVQVHYKPIHTNSFYEKRFGKQELFVATDFYKSQLSLPCHQEMGEDEASFVAQTFLNVVQKYANGCRV